MTITLAPYIIPTVADTIDPVTIVLGGQARIHLNETQAEALLDALETHLEALDTY